MNRKGMSAVGISAVVYGVIPMLTMFLYAFGMDAIAVAFYRFFLILPIVLLITKMQGISLRLPWKQVVSIFVYAGFFSGSTMLLLNLAYNYISIGTATTLHFLYPVFVILICAFYYHDVIDARMKKILLIVLLGILFFLDRKQGKYDRNCIVNDFCCYVCDLSGTAGKTKFCPDEPSGIILLYFAMYMYINFYCKFLYTFHSFYANITRAFFICDFIFMQYYSTWDAAVWLSFIRSEIYFAVFFIRTDYQHCNRNLVFKGRNRGRKAYWLCLDFVCDHVFGTWKNKKRRNRKEGMIWQKCN